MPEKELNFDPEKEKKPFDPNATDEFESIIEDPLKILERGRE